MSLPGGDLKCPFRILDGGLGYSLESRGFANFDSDPLWTARFLHTNPNEIKEAHKSFLAAGANVILTASYQASVDGLMEHVQISEKEAVDLIKKSVQLAKEACREVTHNTQVSGAEGTIDPDVSLIVAGSVGPYGACLHDGSEYTGTYIDSVTKQELKDWHRLRIKALVEAGVDLLAIETIPAQKEAEAVLDLVQAEFPTTNVYVTYSCKDGSHTCHGEKLTEAIIPLVQSDQVIGVGVNCTSPEYVTSLLKTIKGQTKDKAIIVKPNSGENYDRKRGWYGRELCRNVVTYVDEYLENGATWLGGCCHVYSEDIAKISQKVTNWQKEHPQ